MESFNPEAVITRPATEGDAIVVAHWIKDLGWALADEELLKAISRAYDGIAAEYEGVLIGYVSMARLSNDLGICPLVMVKEGCRSKGVGKLLMEKAVKAIGNRTLMIHSIEKAKRFYKHIDISHNKGVWHFYRGQLGTGFCGTSPQHGKLFVKDGDISIEDFAAFEERKVGVSERKNITSEMSMFGTRYAALCNGKITGVLFGHFAPLKVRLKDENCWSIDILIADDVETAVGLVEFAVKDAQKECTVMVLCFPELHCDAKCLIERFKLVKISSGPTLFNKDVNGSPLNLDCVYAITPLI